MDDQRKELVEILNSTPKANLNYAMEIHKRYTNAFDDGLYINDGETGEKKFFLTIIIKDILGDVGGEIKDSYFEALEKFFEQNYLQDKNDFILKTDLFLQMMKVKTDKYFDIENGDKVFSKRSYKNLLGIEGVFDLDEDQTKKQFAFNLVNMFLAEYINKIVYIRVYIIYTILIILEKNEYRETLTDNEIFNAINADLKKEFFESE